MMSLVAPTLNSYGNDRPVAFAVSIDSQDPQTNYFIPLATPGSEPAAWGGNDGFAVSYLCCEYMRESHQGFRRSISCPLTIASL